MGCIAQMNMGFLLHPHEDPRVSEFWDNTDRINAIAERSAGFVWRLQGDAFELPENDIAALFGRPRVSVATLSVWQSFDDLWFFVHKTAHGQFLRRRAEWFEQANERSYVIWPVEEGHIPSLTEAKDRLMLLRRDGPSNTAYDFTFGLSGSVRP